MAKYQLKKTGVIDTETGFIIPDSMDNRHWHEYQEWLAEGNTPDPEPAPPVPTAEQLLSITDRDMISHVGWLFQYLIDGNLIKKEDLPPELDALYTSRKTQTGA
jgi:hypothetical protein